MKAQLPNRILITGASSGLGAALARHYAAPGRTLILWGRDRQRLDSVATDCREAGAQVAVRSLDLSDSAAAIAAIEQEEEAGAIDLALLVAGMGDTRAPGDLVEDATQVARLGLVNFVAAAAMAAALANYMARRGEGRIVLVGSAAGFHALPFAAAYAGSKAPGPRPFVLQASDAAARIARAAARGQAHAIFPWPFILLRWVDRLLPRVLRDRLLLALTPPGD
jgi:short-subunit dehydrogenase